MEAFVAPAWHLYRVALIDVALNLLRLERQVSLVVFNRIVLVIEQVLDVECHHRDADRARPVEVCCRLLIAGGATDQQQADQHYAECVRTSLSRHSAASLLKSMASISECLFSPVTTTVLWSSPNAIASAFWKLPMLTRRGDVLNASNQSCPGARS